jgi:hypothetical protein
MVDSAFTTNVAFDESEEEPCVSGLAVQADGRILVGGCFDYVEGVRGDATRNSFVRLEPDGSVDVSFDPGASGNGPVTPVRVMSLALQADGKILAGGVFETLGGESRTNLGRVSNNGDAAQSLTLDLNTSTAHWRRSGTVPEVEHVSFALSLDGTNYTTLGPGVRTNGGWQLSDLPLPSGGTFFLRARGRSAGGWRGNSGGLMESVAQFWRLPPPFLSRLQIVGGGAFRFSYQDDNEADFMVLAGADLMAPLSSWENLGPAVPIDGNEFQFTDRATNHSQRFYRLQLP